MERTRIILDKENNLIKSLVVDSSPGYTGAFKSIFSLAKILQDSENSAFYFFLANKNLEDYVRLESNIQVSSYRFIGLSRNIYSVIWFFPNLVINSYKVLQLIKKQKIEILHINDIYNLIGVIVKVISPKTKLVYHIRLLPNSYLGITYKYFIRLILHYSDKVICVSEIVRSSLKDFNQEKIELIYDSIEMPKTFVSLNNEVQNLIYLANYTKGKGHDVAINLMVEVVKLYPKIRLIMAGGVLNSKKNEKYKDELMDLVENLGLSGNIMIEGFQEDTDSFLSKGDVFLNFSESESFSMTCLEAMSLGIPIITTDSGGPSEIVLNGETGFIVNNNKRDIFLAVQKLITGTQLRMEMSLLGRKRAKELFPVELAAKRLNSCYTKLLN